MARTIRRLTTLAALLFGVLLPSAAWAATLFVSEYTNIGSINTNTTPWPPGPVVASQTVAVGGASVQSAAFGSTTKLVSLFCDIGCSISIAANPTATTVLQVLQQGITYSFPVSPGQKVAVIANPAGDTPGGSGAPTVVTCGVTATDLCKAEDAVAVTGDTGVAALGVVTDGATPLAAVGDYSWFGTDAAGNTQTVGTGTAGTPAGGVLTIQGQPSMEPVVVSCETGTTSLCQAEDATAATGDSGVAALGVVTDGTTSLAASGDYAWQGLDAAGNGRVVGSVASGATDSGNPVKVGGKYNVTLPTFADGQRGDMQLTTRGKVIVTFGPGASGADGQANNIAYTSAVTDDASTNRFLATGGSVFNGTTWDRMRGTTEGTQVLAIPSATTAVGITSVSSSAAESNHVIKASAGNLYGFSMTTGATAGFAFVANSTTAPTAGGAAIAPIKCYVIAANSTLGVTFEPPLVLSTGITIVFSTTGCFTNTASATAFISGDAK
jgi:hypothetical protein